MTLTKESYRNFVEEFAEGLFSHHPDVCFYVYGSFCRDEHVPGKSDLDGGIIFPGGVVLPKLEVRNIARWLEDCISRNPVDVQFNLLDVKSSFDGRFLSYTADYVDHIMGEHKVLSANDYLPHMKRVDYKQGNLNSAAMNLRLVRNSLLRFCFDDSIYRKNIIDRALKLPKKLIFLSGSDKITTDRKKAFDIVGKMFPGFDVSRLRDLEKLKYEDHDGLSLEHLEEAVDVYEELVERYIDKFPEHTDKEHRT